jgi:hypothetical protein
VNRNRLYLVIAVLAIVVVAAGIYVWREESKPKGVEIRIGEGGISIEEN